MLLNCLCNATSLCPRLQLNLLTQTSFSTGQELAYGCIVTANATLVGGNDDAVLVKDFKAGFAQGRFQDGIAKDNVNSLGADGVLGLNSGSCMPDWKNTRHDGVLDFVDSYSLSLASGNEFAMLNGFDDALIAKNAWTPITLPIVNNYGSWDLGMTAFQVDGLANASAALFPCPSNEMVTKNSGTCLGEPIVGLSYMAMPGYIFEAFEEKYLATSTGCKKSLRARQKIYDMAKMYVCPSTVALPRLAFTFGNATFYLDGKDYVTPKEDEADKVVVELLSAGWWGIGAPFLQKFYMSYRQYANITVYCRAGEHCALNAVANPVPPKGDDPLGWTKKKTSTTDNEELMPPSFKIRNAIVIIMSVLTLFMMAASAFYRHKKRKQHAIKMAAANEAAISSPWLRHQHQLLLAQRRTRPSRPQTPRVLDRRDRQSIA